MLNQGPKPPKPEEFAGAVAESDGYELAAAQTALAQSRDARVRSFAEQMISDHQQMARTFREAAKASGLEAPSPRVGGDQARFLGSLQSLRGVDFDREYFRQQALAHASALATLRGYVAKGADPSLRQAAASRAPMVEQHLRAAREALQSFM